MPSPCGMNDEKINLKDKGRAAFPSTHWSQLAATLSSSDAKRYDALNWLIKRYWKPVYAYIRCRGNSDQDAQDLTQAFFTTWLERDLFSQADPKRGRFRNYLLSSLSNFLINAHRDAHTRKRRPEGGLLSISDLAQEPSYQDGVPIAATPEEIFHRAWLIELLKRVADRLRDEFYATGKESHFEIFRHRIIVPILEGTPPPAQIKLALKYHLTEKQVANQLITARRAYQRLLREEVCNYATSEDDAKTEIQDLFEFIGAG